MTVKKRLPPLMWWANIGFVGMLFGAYLAPFCSPATWWLPAFIGLFYPFFLLVNLFFIGFWLFKKNRYAWLSILAVLIGANHFTGIVGFGGGATPPSNAIKVMSFNARYFDALLNQRNPDKKMAVVKQMLANIQKEKPDILCGQDFTGDNGTTNEVVYAFLKNECGLKYRFQKTPSLITFSRFPILESGAEVFKGSYNSFNYIDIDIGDSPLRVYNLHLQSSKLGEDAEQFLASENLTTIEDPQTRQYYRGVFGRLRRAFQKRAGQAQLVAKHISQSPYPVVVCGDFNDTPSSFAYRMVSKGLKDSFRECGFGMGSTYAGSLPFLRIDYILTSPKINIYSHKVIRKSYSDHYAVVSVIGK